MNSKERVEKSLKHEEPDRIPIGEIEINSKQATEILKREAFVGIGGNYFVKQRAEMLISGEIENYAKNTGIDSVELCTGLDIDFYRIWPNQYKGSIIPEEVRENVWRYTDNELNYWEEIQYSPQSNAWGLTNDSIMNRGGIEEFERYVKRLENATELSIGLSFYQMAVSKAIDQKEFIALKTALSHSKGQEVFIVGNARIPFPGSAKWLPVYFEAMLIKPNLLKRYCDILSEVWLKYIEKQLEIGACGIVDGMDIAYNNGLLISPECFKKFILPYLKKYSAKCHEYNKPFIKHTDGNIMSVEKEFLLDSGIDGYHAIEPLAGMDIFYLKEKYGKNITLLGNVDCSELLISGARKEIEDNVKKLVTNCKNGGGYILSSSNSIHDGISLENYKVMINAGKEYGKY